MRILGIDPGVSGAYALLADDGISSPIVDDLPVVGNQINAGEWRRVIKTLMPDIAIVELVHSMPGQGVASTFRFGMACGIIRGVLLGAGAPIIDVTPNTWKKYFKLGNDGEKSRALACQRFPNLPGLARKKDHNRAEALLIALWKLETDDPV
jgi:Holliday junction resolvasome RuvABC endonuclease subunit